MTGTEEPEEPERIVRVAAEVAALLGDDWTPLADRYPAGRCTLHSANLDMLVRLEESDSGKTIKIEPLVRYPDGTHEVIRKLTSIARRWSPETIAQIIPRAAKPEIYRDEQIRLLTNRANEQAWRKAEEDCARRLMQLREAEHGAYILPHLSTARGFSTSVAWRNELVLGVGHYQFRHPRMTATVRTSDSGRQHITVEIMGFPEEKIGALLDLLELPAVEYAGGYTPGGDAPEPAY